MDQEFQNKFRSRATFQYKVGSLTQLKINEEVYSPVNYVRNLPWRIKSVVSWLGREKHFSIYLCGDGSSRLKWSCDLKFTIKLINQKFPVYSMASTFSHIFTVRSHCYGSYSFIPYNRLIDPKHGFIVDDSVIVQVDITAGVPRNDSVTVDTLYDMLDAKGEMLEGIRKDLTTHRELLESNCWFRRKYIETLIEVQEKQRLFGGSCLFSREEETCDVIIKTRDHKNLYAHQVVLKARSPAFAKVIDKQHFLNPKEPTRIFVSGIDYEMMQSILLYIYTGMIDLEEHNVFEVLKAAEKFELNEVKDRVSMFLSKKMREIEAGKPKADEIEVGMEALEYPTDYSIFSRGGSMIHSTARD